MEKKFNTGPAQNIEKNGNSIKTDGRNFNIFHPTKRNLY
jgi:hypothetical protein